VRKVFVALLATFLLTASVLTARAVSHPDSRTESLGAGCNRSDFGLLGEAAATMKGGPHPSGFASWVYVEGKNAPKQLEGTVLGTHTAGTDLFGVHDTYDLDIDIAPDPDPEYDKLLSTRNADEHPVQIHTEWESGLAPLFVWPSPGDRVHETGSEIWDCGHWQDGEKSPVPSQELTPGDPLGSAGDLTGDSDHEGAAPAAGDALEANGVQPAEGEEIEIHPIMELATWRAHGDFTPTNETRPVHASELDVAISNQGGKAKGIEECALLAPKQPDAVAGRIASDVTCSTVQRVAGRNYTYELKPPGSKPSTSSQLMVQSNVLYGHHAPSADDVKIDTNEDTGIVKITVPFGSIDASNDLQDFGAIFHAWWSNEHAPVRHFAVTQVGVTIYNNLDADSGDTDGNPGITPEGEWNMFTDVGGHWTNLHDPRPGHTDLLPLLGAVPSVAHRPVELPIPGLTTDVYLPYDAALHLFSDARECDQPGYVDCPTEHNGIGELATTGGSAGRGDIAVPVKQLFGRSTTITIHPIVCGNTGRPDCTGEQDNPYSRCKDTSCYSVTFRVDDLDAVGRTSGPTIIGDGTPGGTLVGAASASSMSWWLDPPTRYAPDEGEEYVHVARVVRAMRAG